MAIALKVSFLVPPRIHTDGQFLPVANGCLAAVRQRASAFVGNGGIQVHEATSSDRERIRSSENKRGLLIEVPDESDDDDRCHPAGRRFGTDRQ
jgi:hypothetical protein